MLPPRPVCRIGSSRDRQTMNERVAPKRKGVRKARGEAAGEGARPPSGAESLLGTLVGAGVEVCFTNPGTSEMHFVTALDKVPEMRGILTLFEGVASAAADGYGRMAGKPGSTLLHLGPGLGNAISNFHNARKARTPIVNLVGEHATTHLAYDAPLTADIEAIARPVSRWVRTSLSASTIAHDAAEAVAAAAGLGGGIATLIVPADASWDPSTGPVAPIAPVLPRRVGQAIVESVARALKGARKAAILARGTGLYGEGLESLGRIAAKTGATLFADTFAPRLERGAGRPVVHRMPYFAEDAAAVLEAFDVLVIAGTPPPVSFFAYPGKPSFLAAPGCAIHPLASPDDDVAAALADLADALGAPRKAGKAVRYELSVPGMPAGALDQAKVGAIVARLLPEGAIVSDECITSGAFTNQLGPSAKPHDILWLSGGAIGFGIPLATGTAVACPDRKSICLEGDGSGMYTLQALWTQARERLDVVTIIFANRSYKILHVELGRVGVDHETEKARRVLDIDDPALDWVKMSEGLGVPARRVDTAEAFADVLKAALAQKGPFLIEAVIP
jgi:acetolactate synthase-1/2/3 large subunit